MACGGSNRRKSRGRSPRAIKLQVFYWKHHFAIFLPLFGYFTQFWSVFNETQDLSFFFKVVLNRGVVFSVFRFVCLLGWPQADFFQKMAKMLRFFRKSGFKLLFRWAFRWRGRFSIFQSRLFVKLAAGPFSSKNGKNAPISTKLRI